MIYEQNRNSIEKNIVIYAWAQFDFVPVPRRKKDSLQSIRNVDNDNYKYFAFILSFRFHLMRLSALTSDVEYAIEWKNIWLLWISNNFWF